MRSLITPPLRGRRQREKRNRNSSTDACEIEFISEFRMRNRIEGAWAKIISSAGALIRSGHSGMSVDEWLVMSVFINRCLHRQPQTLAAGFVAAPLRLLCGLIIVSHRPHLRMTGCAPLTTLAAARPCHCTAATPAGTHTHTHMRRHASPEPPTNTQAKQNKSGSNNLIQFDWPDEQVLLAKETLLREAERGKRGLQRERWREGDSVRVYGRTSRYASSICCVYSMSLRVVHAPPSSPLCASLLPAPPADSSSLPA